MDIIDTLYVPTSAEWRDWLARNHDRKDHIWLVFYRKETGQPTLVYDQAVEEALCFGWIDGIKKKLDDQRYTYRFTPRRPGSNWSDVNKKRVVRLIADGRMTPAGLARVDFDPAAVDPDAPPVRRPVPDLPDDLEQALRTDARAWAAYQRLAPSHKRQYLGWVLSAKKPETRQRRMAEVIEVLSQGRELGLK